MVIEHLLPHETMIDGEAVALDQEGRPFFNLLAARSFSAPVSDPQRLHPHVDLATHQITALPVSQGLFSLRWSPDGRYIAALNSNLTRLLLFDFQTKKWTELAKDSPDWPEFTRDCQYLHFGDSTSGDRSLMGVRMSDLHV